MPFDRQLTSSAANDLAGFRVFHRRDHRPAGLDHTGLLGGDGGVSFAQELLVVEINIRDHRHARDGDIGRIEPAAHPDFEHNEIRGLASEINESAGGEKLKETWPLG